MVSICIPSYNGALWIAEAIESALAQNHHDLEVIVCDDGSTDETVSVARAFRDPRVRVLANEVRVGMARNWNRCVQASSGQYVKFLMQDDRLVPGCVSSMLEVMEADPRVGLVFSPREVQLDDPIDPDSLLWKRRFGVLHTAFGPIAHVNDGRAMFNRMRGARFAHNWIGEPTAVMVRRQVLEHVGLFNVRLLQRTDLEMWLRIAFFYRVGFVPDSLATFRVHRRSASMNNQKSDRAWLDRVWLLEGLRAYQEIRAALGAGAEASIWFYLIRSMGKRLIGLRGPVIRMYSVDLRDYLSYRLERGRHALHQGLEADRTDSHP